MKINNEKLKEINDLYSQFKRNDEEIDSRNLFKEFWLKQIIKELKQTDLLKSIEDIEEVKSAQFNIWNDVENPNWMELEIKICTKRISSEFDNYEDFIKYEYNIRAHIYKILDDNPKLSNFIMVYIERGK